jgi:hypothetical protein
MRDGTISAGGLHMRDGTDPRGCSTVVNSEVVVAQRMYGGKDKYEKKIGETHTGTPNMENFPLS